MTRTPEQTSLSYRDFQCNVTKVWNGFVIRIGNFDFVVQGSGDVRDDFEDVLDAVRTAYYQAVGIK